MTSWRHQKCRLQTTTNILQSTVLGSDRRSCSDRRSEPNPNPIPNPNPNPNPNPSRSERINFSFNSLLSFRSPIWTYNYPFTKAFQTEKAWHCKSFAKRIREQKLESWLIKSLSEKLINSVPFGSGRRRTSPCRHCSVQWRRTVAVSQHALRTTLHIVNIDFELN